MRIENSVHQELSRAHHWRVATLAPDFELLDVWRIPIRTRDDTSLLEFLEFMAGVQRDLVAGSGIAAGLFRVRQWMGNALGWDGKPDTERAPLSIPGCAEASLRDRLAPDEAGEDATTAGMQSFAPVYRTADDCLLEISNSTVHALMHFGREPVGTSEWSPLMAVYVKPRGTLGRFYMALIGPFRHAVVYPTLMRAAERAWPNRTPTPSPANSDLQ